MNATAHVIATARQVVEVREAEYEARKAAEAAEYEDALAAEAAEWAKDDLQALFGEIAETYEVSPKRGTGKTRSGTVTSPSGGVLVWEHRHKVFDEMPNLLRTKGYYNFRLYKTRRFRKSLKSLSAVEAARVLDGK